MPSKGLMHHLTRLMHAVCSGYRSLYVLGL